MFALLKRLFRKTEQPRNTLPEAVARAAESKIGVREQGGSNKGAALQPFFDADWYKPDGPDHGYAWCAAFVCWAVQTAAAGREITFSPPRTPRAWGFEGWARKEGLNLKKPAKLDIRRGDIVVFEFSHIGVAVSSPDESGYFDTVEGNTNAAGSREGDGVYQKRRHASQIRSRVRLPD